MKRKQIEKERKISFLLIENFERPVFSSLFQDALSNRRTKAKIIQQKNHRTRRKTLKSIRRDFPGRKFSFGKVFISTSIRISICRVSPSNK